MFLTTVNNEIRSFLDLCCDNCSKLNSIFCLKIEKGIDTYQWFNDQLIIKLNDIFVRMPSEDIRVGEVIYEIVYAYLLSKEPLKRAHKIATYIANRSNRNLNFEMDFAYIQDKYREWR